MSGSDNNAEENYVVVKLLDGEFSTDSERYVIVRSTWINNNLVSYPEITSGEDGKGLVKDFLKNEVRTAPSEWKKYTFALLNVYGKLE